MWASCCSGGDSGPGLGQPWPARVHWPEEDALWLWQEGCPQLPRAVWWLVVRRWSGGLWFWAPLLGGGGGWAGLASGSGQRVGPAERLQVPEHKYRLPDPAAGAGHWAEGPDSALYGPAAWPHPSQGGHLPRLWPRPAVLLRRRKALPHLHLQRELWWEAIPLVWYGGDREGSGDQVSCN